MKKSRVLTLGLACFFTAVTAFSTLAATSGERALYSHLNDVSHASSPHSQGGSQGTYSVHSGGVLQSSQAGQQDGHNASGAATAQNGPLNLNPATDETIYTTESGVEIKSHNVSATGAESTIQYFTLGSYNGEPVNWLIVGVGTGSDSTPAGIAIAAETDRQKLVTGVTSGDISGQILCISEYAFNQEVYTPQYKAHAATTVTFNYYNAESYPTSAAPLFKTTSDEVSDYHDGSYTPTQSPDLVQNMLSLAQTLGLNQYYGTGSGKIINNSAFSTEYVFSMDTGLYSSCVSSTNYGVPYLFTSKTTATYLWTSNSNVKQSIRNGISGYNTYGYNSLFYNWQCTGTADMKEYFNNVINPSGGMENFLIAQIDAVPASTGGVYSHSEHSSQYKWCHFKTTYTATNNSISIAYRPAFMMKL